jgi:endonuclease/exonuclease/phosphatase family metal-dependent hydrolase
MVIALLVIPLLFFSDPGYAQPPISLSVTSQNLKRFFDDRDDGNKEKVLSTEKYHQRLNQFVTKILHTYQQPDVLMLQEVENIRVLQDISRLLKSDHGVAYLPFLIEGNDSSGIDVGYLIKDSWRVQTLSALFKNTSYGPRNNDLFSRPPLLVKICSSRCITLVNLHLRSMRGLRTKNKGKRVASKRQLQAESIARWIQRFQSSDPQALLLIGGDFNALTPADTYFDVVGAIRGDPDNSRTRWKSRDLVSRDLIDVTQRIPAMKRYSYKYRGKKQQLDYLLVSSNLLAYLEDVEYSVIDYRFSDHAAVSGRFVFN